MHFNSSINPAHTSFTHLQPYFQTKSVEWLDELVSTFSVQTPNMEELIVDELKKQYEVPSMYREARRMMTTFSKQNIVSTTA